MANNAMLSTKRYEEYISKMSDFELQKEKKKVRIQLVSLLILPFIIGCVALWYGISVGGLALFMSILIFLLGGFTLVVLWKFLKDG